MEKKLPSSDNFNADIDYLSAESNVDSDSDEDEDELTAGLYFSLPDISAEFDCYLTEPLFPSIPSDDFLNSVFSLELDPLLVSGLILVPNHGIQEPQIEYVSLSSDRAPNVTFFSSQSLEILQSCNGLFLCFSHLSRSYSVCNLTTQELESIPTSEFIVDDQFALNLVYDPYTSPDYKVICVHKTNDHHHHQLSIYSSETRVWTLCGAPFEPPRDLDLTHGVFSNGAVHWMKWAPAKGLYFHIDKQELKEMPKPSTKEGCSLVSCEYFGESQGCLYYVLACIDFPCLEVFQMKEDYTGWIFKTRINLKALSQDFPVVRRRSDDNVHPFLSSYECDVLFVSQGWGEEGVDVVLSIPGQVVAYNQHKNCATKLCDLRVGPDDRSVWYRVYSCYQYSDLSLHLHHFGNFTTN